MKVRSRRIRARSFVTLSIALLGLTAAVAPALPASASIHRAVAAPTEVSLRAGLNDPKNPNIAILEFLPSSFKVATGTTVTWDIAGPEPHSVTFVPPGQPRPDVEKDSSLTFATPATGPYDGTTFVNSGVVPLGPTTSTPKFSMSFSKPGTYTYYCVLHPNMDGTVQVTGDTQDSQKKITKNGNAQLAKWESEGQAAAAKLAKTKPKSTTNADGSKTYSVQMGASTAHTDVLAFAPSPQKVKAGDHVTFVNNSAAPHTASFGGSLIPVIPTADNVVNPVPGPSPQTIVPSTYLNSGWLPPKTSGAPVAARSYTYDVPDPGTFTYECVLHVGSGMLAEVEAS